MQCYPGITEFQRYVADYIESNGCHGRNGYNDRVSFMPRIALDQFWSTERIENILRSPPERIQAMSHTIRSRYVVVFSILVFMSQPEHIPIFIQEAIEDSQLPLAGTPYVFSETPESGIFDEFHKHQWKFCPLEFDNGYKLSKRRISPYHVVPVLDKAPINPRAAADEDDVTIYKVTLHPSCFHQTVVVFKVFSGEDHDTEKMYDNEVDMYSQLVRESAFNHIIRYYGSFETAGLRTIVLEYANGGSLKSFFLNSPPPHSRGNCEQFWNSLMGLLRGLENIHNLNESKRYSKGAWVLRGTHQDIKPQNILLCNTSFENMYDITFKFVDMGTGNIRKMKNQGLDRDALDQAGNGMYSAPEACQDDGEAKGIRGNSDVWSFGGIASEALVWCMWGEYGRSQYQTERFRATQKTILKGGYHEGAFHDGDCVLDVVADRHRRAIAATGESTDWWSKLSALILERMLVPEPRERATATDLLREWFGPPRLTSHNTEPIQPSTRPRPVSLEQVDDPKSSLRAPATVPNIHKDLKRLEIRTEEAKTSKEYLHQPPSSSDTMPEIVLPRDENPEHQRRTSVFATHGAHRRCKSQPRSPNYGPIGHSGLGDDLYSPDPSFANMPGRKRAVSQGSAERLAPPVDKFREDNHSITSATTVVGEPEIYQSTAERFTHQPQGFQHSSENMPSDAFRQHRTQNAWEVETATHRPERTTVPNYRTEHYPTAGLREPGFIQSRELLEETPTIDRVWNECFTNERFTSKLMRTPSAWRLFRAFPGLRRATNLLKGTFGRDQIFLVDDSISMLSHREALAKTCRVLCYILKTGNVDPDSYELHFTSGRQMVESKTSTTLQEAIKEMPFTKGPCDMATRLDDVVSSVIGKSKAASVYVLTNGHWNIQDDEKFCLLDYPIGRLVGHIRENRKQRNWVGVQFIRFFETPETQSDQLGRQRLEALDDDLKSKINDDIVDTTDFNGDITKMLLGAISPVADREGRRRLKEH